MRPDHRRVDVATGRAAPGDMASPPQGLTRVLTTPRPALIPDDVLHGMQNKMERPGVLVFRQAGRGQGMSS